VPVSTWLTAANSEGRSVVFSGVPQAARANSSTNVVDLWIFIAEVLSFRHKVTKAPSFTKGPVFPADHQSPIIYH
jgi:hypothetical protein